MYLPLEFFLESLELASTCYKFFYYSSLAGSFSLKLILSLRLHSN